MHLVRRARAAHERSSSSSQSYKDSAIHLAMDKFIENAVPERSSLTTELPRTVCRGFLRSCESFPNRPAVEVGRTRMSYQELRDRAASLAATLQRRTPAGGSALAAVFAYRTPTAFAGVLAALFAGRGYVPLNRTFPSARTRLMLLAADCRAAIVDSESAAQLNEVLEGIDEPLLLILPEQEDVRVLAQRWPNHIFLGAKDLEPASLWELSAASPDSIAYLLFTSGSTGIPKGVMVAHRNVLHFVDVMTQRYTIQEEDRFSQNFDMTFDLSAFDMFVAWDRGACVCCPSQKTLINPGKFIQEASLTVWFSVPSSGVFMKRLGMLKPNRYPALRWSLFCGEPLPAEIAEAWAEATPNSVVENLYGPTELTIACMHYRWNRSRSLGESECGIVPIGQPYRGMEVLVVDERLHEVFPGAEGELLMTGPQLSLGYWRDTEKTAAAFVNPPGRNTIYYRTGDRVRRPIGDEPLRYLGRLDHQVKILGHRVELGEVEATLRQETGAEMVVVVSWPMTPSGPCGLVAFLAGGSVDTDAVRRRLKARLPLYAVPREIRVLPELPLNLNGKVDRKALLRILETSA